MGKNLKSLFTLQKKILRQEQEKATKTNKHQNNSKQQKQNWSKTTSKNKETKKQNKTEYNFQRNKLMLSDKNWLSLVVEGPLQNLFWVPVSLKFFELVQSQGSFLIL